MHGWLEIHTQKTHEWSFLLLKGGEELRDGGGGKSGRRRRRVRAERFCKSMEVWLLLQPKL